MNKTITSFLILVLAPLGIIQAQVNAKQFAPSFRYCPDRDYDLAWENNLIAFRVYGMQPNPDDGLSGIDAWHKKVSYPVLDKWYNLSKQGKSYHNDYGEGCDQYHVGKTRGVGGIGLWINNEIVRSGLYEYWEVISQTQTKISFRLVYSWTINGEQIVENRIISLENGSQLYSAESHFTKNGMPVTNLEIAIGLSTQNGIAEVSLNPSDGWMSAWHELGNNVGMIGTGATVEPKYLVTMIEQKRAEKDASHSIAVVKTDTNGAIRWNAGFAWQEAGKITSAKEWNKYLSEY